MIPWRQGGAEERAQVLAGRDVHVLPPARVEDDLLRVALVVAHAEEEAERLGHAAS
jgi:hypothetical protein